MSKADMGAGAAEGGVVTASNASASQVPASIKSEAQDRLWEYAFPHHADAELTERDLHMFLAGFGYSTRLTAVMGRQDFQTAVVTLAHIFGDKAA